MNARSSFHGRSPGGPKAISLIGPMLIATIFVHNAYGLGFVRPCGPTDSTLVCRLESVLTMLQTAAVILGLLLIIAVLAAVRAYRRKAPKITPDDITPDAD